MQQDQQEQQAQKGRVGERFLDILAEEGDERLRKRVREHELGADDEDLPLAIEHCIVKEWWRRRHMPTRVDLGEMKCASHLHLHLADPPTLGVRPLKNELAPSVLSISLMTATPETLVLKLAFWIRVLTTSRGAATVIDATAPATDATKSAVS